MQPQELRAKIDVLQSAVDRAIAAEDTDLLQKQYAELNDLCRQLLPKDAGAKPFKPGFELSIDPQEQPAAAGIIDREDVVDAANAAAQLARRISYNLKLFFGYTGPKLVSNGDSWFQYPAILTDVIDYLSEPFAIHSFGAAGAELSEMTTEQGYLGAVEAQKPSAFFV